MCLGLFSSFLTCHSWPCAHHGQDPKKADHTELLGFPGPFNRIRALLKKWGIQASQAPLRRESPSRCCFLLLLFEVLFFVCLFFGLFFWLHSPGLSVALEDALQISASGLVFAAFCGLGILMPFCQPQKLKIRE